MRHRKSINHLGRTTSHRKAMLSNMAASLILHKRIKTTVAKAKALRQFVEPLITKSKTDSTHSRRMVFSTLMNKEAVTELFREISPKITDRPGGYTRILKTGTRIGDNADMCIIELVDYNENLLSVKDDAKAKSGRRKRKGTGKGKSVASETTGAKTKQEATEEVVESADTKTEAAETGPETVQKESGDASTVESVAEQTAEDTTEIKSESKEESKDSNQEEKGKE